MPHEQMRGGGGEWESEENKYRNKRAKKGISLGAPAPALPRAYCEERARVLLTL
jgi:hypothetical protein